MDLSIVLILILTVLEFCRCGTSLPSSWTPGHVSSIGAPLKILATRNMYQCERLCQLTSPCVSARFSVTTRLCSLYRDVPGDSDISSSRTDVVVKIDKQNETMLTGACSLSRCPDGRVCVATGDTRTCLIAGLSCPPPVTMSNADVTYSTPTYNSVASYTCQTGYNFTGLNPQAKCSSDASWKGVDGQCTISCGPPASIVKANVMYTTTTFNSTAVYTCHVGYVFKGGNRQAVCSADGRWEGPDGQCIKPQDCLDILNDNSSSPDGVYIINPTDNSPIKVYCDMTDDGGGWTVFQRRTDGSEDFYKNWGEYKKGFGVLRKEFWLGNDNIYEITNQKVYSLKVDLEDFDNNKTHASYSHFYIDDESLKYKLNVTGYSGDAGDSLANQDQMKFTTKNQDNDQRNGSNCARECHGAWWYKDCHHSNLNGEYNNTKESEGINWYFFKGYEYSLKYTAMKIRPT